MEFKIVVPEITLASVVADVVNFDEDGDAYTEGTVTVGDKVAQIIATAVMKTPEYTNLRNRVTEIRTDEIRQQLRPIIAEALQNPIRRTNSWGDATGEETTLKDVIVDEARKAWDTADRNSYSSRDTPGIRETIRQEVRKHIGQEVAKAVKEAQEAALKAVGDLAAAPVVDAVRKALGK